MTTTPTDPPVDPTPVPDPPPTTDVTGKPRRPIAPDTFADITKAELLAITDLVEARQVTLTFAGVLSPAVKLRIWSRLSSVSDQDAEDRAALKDLAEQVKADPTLDPNSPLVRLVLRLNKRTLNDT